MEIEYQKKDVTWCLDRDGPRICLRAVTINDELQYLQISSESFSLDLKTSEAQEFLSILKNLSLSKEPDLSFSKEISSDIIKEISDEIFDEKPADTQIISSFRTTESVNSTPSLDTSEILDVLQQSEPSIDKEFEDSAIISSPSSDLTESLEPSPTLDTSEILDVLKQSEVQEEEIPVKIRRLGSLFEKEEQVTLTPSPDTYGESDVFKRSEGELEDELTQLTDILTGKEEPNKEFYEASAVQVETQKLVKGIITEENVKPSAVLREKVETASFFHKVEEKSPLEQILDEDKDEEKSVSLSPPISSEEDSKGGVESTDYEKTEEIAPFSPDDLQSSSFVSDFNSKKEDYKSETNEIDLQESNLQPSKDNSHQLESVSERSYTTETERKKQIEKEREARKKRLWELTRGF